MRILVLGCGPAGLITAHTALQHGAEVSIYSRKQKSEIYGAQWLQHFIPGITRPEPDGQIMFVMLGSEEEYARKVFSDPKHPTGWREHKDGAIKPGWNIRFHYDMLWDIHKNLIVNKDLDSEEVARLEWDNWDYIFNTVPLWNICNHYKAYDWDTPVHRFEKYKVLIQPAHREESGRNQIIYNGRSEDEWFRGSTIFGVNGGYEYPITSHVTDATMVRKPQHTNCDCWSNIIRVGRYGAWHYSALVHDGYFKVKEKLG